MTRNIFGAAMPLLPRLVLLSLLIVSVAAQSAAARVLRVKIDHREVVAGGKSYGLPGPYERIYGTVSFAVHPDLPVNRIITDIDRAPRNTGGAVEFSADFYLLKPTEISRGNGALLYEASNRGVKAVLTYFNLAPLILSPASAEDLGDGFLMREGYTVLWLGWQFDPVPGKLRLYPPQARGDNGPLRGLARSDFVVDARVFHHSLAHPNHIAYPVADPLAPENILTVRDGVTAPRKEIPRSSWRFARFEGQGPVPDPTHVYLEEGFEPGKIYEVVYVAQDPPVVGLGLAAVRDAVSHLKHEGAGELSIPAGSIRRALSWGSSQPGRFLRNYLYLGFNEDERQRRVFDGMIPHVAGAGRGSFNHRFAQPSRDAQPFANFFYPTDIFPFTDVVQTDPETGLSEGLLSRFPKPDFMPKIFYTNSSYEYWGRAASLIHTTIDGRGDAPIPDNVRHYFFAGSQHGFGRFPPAVSTGQQLDNPMDYRWPLRALLLALDRWVADGTPPPPSRYPRIDRGTLVPFESFRFPALPGWNVPRRAHQAYRVDYGPRFRTEGIITDEPPRVGASFPLLVPSVNEDGNEMDGIRLPELAVPLGTYTGWNLFNGRAGPAHELVSFRGSYLPFAPTKASRSDTKDPRLSIHERYRSREEYLGLVSESALQLVEQGYLLDADLPRVLDRSRRQWDYLMKETAPPGR